MKKMGWSSSFSWITI